jgi:hypothetical protein
MDHALSLFTWLRGQIELPTPRESTTYYIYSGEYPKIDWESTINWIYGLRFGLQEFVFVCILIYLCILLYRKIKYPFWNIQPVLHDYDLFSRWIWKTPRIICKTPVKLKYFHRISTRTIKTEPADTMTREQATQISQFLRENWIPSDRILSTIIEKNIFSLFVGHEYKSFYSVLSGAKVDAETAEPPIEGVIISHPVIIYFRDTAIKIPASAIAYMAVKRDEKDDSTIHALFQTHEYTQRIEEPKLAITLFKKEVTGCDSLVPFIQYSCSLYYLRLFMKLPRLPAHYHIVEIGNRTNTDILHNLFERKYIQTIFPYAILNSMPNILALVKTRQIRIFYLKRKEDVFAFYFYRDPHLFYEDLNGKQIDLVASFINTEDFELAYHGFLHSLREINREKKPDDLYNVFQIHGLGHNQILEEKWKQHHTKILETPVMYYLYNYIHETVNAKDVFMV